MKVWVKEGSKRVGGGGGGAAAGGAGGAGRRRGGGGGGYRSLVMSGGEGERETGRNGEREIGKEEKKEGKQVERERELAIVGEGGGGEVALRFWEPFLRQVVTGVDFPHPTPILAASRRL